MIKKNKHIFFLFLALTIAPITATSQEEKESADTSLEENSDAFQECFFEAMRQQAIENYEKAVAKLMECKRTEPENEVIDYELGKNYAALKRYEQAETYLKNALTKNPENRWYLDALFETYKAQGKESEAIELGKQLAQKHPVYKENLASLYAKNQQYKEAIQLLDELNNSLGTTAQRTNQRIRYMALMSSDKPYTESKNQETIPPPVNPLNDINRTIEIYEKAADYKSLSTYIDGILENYPAQATFYYIKGKTLLKRTQYKEAISVLETALDFLADDKALEKNIYKELAAAYTALGNQQKAQEYLQKLKNKS